MKNVLFHLFILTVEKRTMRISEIEMPDTIDGKPTRNNLGQLIHPTVEGIKNFWRWFGDSKVVDSKGRPLVMYHGTYPTKMQSGKMLGDFDAFNRKASTEIVKRIPSYDQVGLWFSSKPGNPGAEGYGNFIYPVYLRAIDYKRTTFDAMVKTMYRLAAGESSGKDFSPAMAKDVEPYREFLRDNGYDSVLIFHDSSRENYSTEFKDQTVWIVLEPEQVKSAVGNNGNFSPNSQKITEKSVKIT